VEGAFCELLVKGFLRSQSTTGSLTTPPGQDEQCTKNKTARRRALLYFLLVASMPLQNPTNPTMARISGISKVFVVVRF
jgi:hypothetical protein